MVDHCPKSASAITRWPVYGSYGRRPVNKFVPDAGGVNPDAGGVAVVGGVASAGVLGVAENTCLGASVDVTAGLAASVCAVLLYGVVMFWFTVEGDCIVCAVLKV